MGYITRLAAVNTMLRAAGEQPVSSLVSDTINDTDVAQAILDEVTTEVQLQGAGYNIEIRTLNPESNGKITVPSGVVEIDGSGQDAHRNLVERHGHLYDVDNTTDVFEEPVEVRVTLRLDFEDIPTQTQKYIQSKAARVYQQRIMGDPQMDQYLAEQEMKDRLNCMKSEGRVLDKGWVGTRWRYGRRGAPYDILDQLNEEVERR